MICHRKAIYGTRAELCRIVLALGPVRLSVGGQLLARSKANSPISQLILGHSGSTTRSGWLSYTTIGRPPRAMRGRHERVTGDRCDQDEFFLLGGGCGRGHHHGGGLVRDIHVAAVTKQDIVVGDTCSKGRLRDSRCTRRGLTRCMTTAPNPRTQSRGPLRRPGLT